MFSVKIEPADPEDIAEDTTTLKLAVKIKEETLNSLPLTNEANGDGLIKKGMIFDSDSERIVFGFVRDPTVNASCGKLLAPGCYEELMQMKQYACDWCPKMFSNRFDVIKHNLEHLRVYLIGQKMHQCAICQAIFTQKKHLTVHSLKRSCQRSKNKIKKRISDQLHECELCNKTFQYKHWHEHMKTVHDDRTPNTQWKCSICFKVFKCKRYLFRHTLYIHEKQKPDWMKRKERYKYSPENLKCIQCPKVFQSRDCLMHHFKNVHKDEGKAFSCTICGSVMKSDTYLRSHMRRVHSNGISHPCEICSKSFISLSYLRAHERNTHFKKEIKIDSNLREFKRNTIFQKQVKEENHFEEDKALKNTYIQKGEEQKFFGEDMVMKNAHSKREVYKKKDFEEFKITKNTNFQKVKNGNDFKEFEIINVPFKKVMKNNECEEFQFKKNINFRKEFEKDKDFEEFDIIPPSLGVHSNVRIIEWKDM